MKVNALLKKYKVPSKEELLKRVQVFELEYESQSKIIEDKLKVSSGDNKIRIIQYKTDLNKFKDMSDSLKRILLKKGIRGKLSQTKFIMISSKKYLLFNIKIVRKYKKEDCDIVNFET